MAKPHITRTFGPIHFEDLDPHRFEDLVRELIYDFKDWQTIDATGRGGADDGFDTRAYEKSTTNFNYNIEEDNEDQELPMEGNLWMIQCKRESEVGPTKISSIIQKGIDPPNPPYGYILVASANFSKKSYDVFRIELKRLGVMEFYLWGKAELEDMLHMPKYDRILFTFFGISLISRRKTKTAEIKYRVNNKNKLYRLLGNEHHNLKKRILIRDTKDSEYPYNDKYPDFQKNPRWLSVMAMQFAPNGLWVQYHEYYAFVDVNKKEWDYSTEVDLLYQPNKLDEEKRDDKYFEQRDKVEFFWENFPAKNQAKVVMWGLIPFEDILLIDDKGDIYYDFPHIYTDFKATLGPFSRSTSIIEKGQEHYQVENDGFNKISIFPKKAPGKKLKKIYHDKKLSLNRDIIHRLKSDYEPIQKLYKYDNSIDFLQQGDVIAVENTKPEEQSMYVRITSKYSLSTKEFIDQSDHFYIKEFLKEQTGKEPVDDDTLTIYEFKIIYEWQIKNIIEGNVA